MLEHLDNVVAQTTLTLTLLTALTNLVLRALRSVRSPDAQKTFREISVCIIEVKSSDAFCLEVHMKGTSENSYAIRIRVNADDDPESDTPTGLYPTAQGKQSATLGWSVPQEKP